MSTLHRNDLRNLLKKERAPCVSIYLPTRPGPQNMVTNQLYLKNLKAAAQRGLVEFGIDPIEAQRIISLRCSRHDRDQLWRDTKAGMAVFMTSDFEYIWHSSVEVPERIYVGSHFDIVPLLNSLDHDKTAYVISVSRNKAQLWLATLEKIEAVSIPGFPESMRATLNIDTPDNLGHQSHGGVRLGKSRKQTVFHGQGNESQHIKQEMVEYFRILNSKISQVISNKSVPLIFAGVQEEWGIFGDVCTYPLLLDEYIPGNPDRLTSQDLHKAVLPLLESELTQERDAVIRVASNVAAKIQDSCQLSSVFSALKAGQVEQVLIDEKRQAWGLYDPVSASVVLHEQRKPESEELLNLVAREALNHDAEIVLVSEQELPTASPVAVTYRFIDSHALQV
jgi:hypothetical protein